MDHKSPSFLPSLFRPKNPFRAPTLFRDQRIGQEVGKATKATGKRIGGALRSEQARQQKRRDAKRGGH